MQATGLRLGARNGMDVCILAVVCIILLPVFADYAYPPETGDVPFCEPIDFSQVQPEGSEAAGKRAFNLNAGDPRTVRVIYFVPNDRSFSATVEDSIKRAVRQVRTFFADQMKAHGFGLNAINIARITSPFNSRWQIMTGFTSWSCLPQHHLFGGVVDSAKWSRGADWRRSEMLSLTSSTNAIREE